jgi:hypothetical protein
MTLRGQAQHFADVAHANLFEHFVQIRDGRATPASQLAVRHPNMIGHQRSASAPSAAR